MLDAICGEMRCQQFFLIMKEPNSTAPILGKQDRVTTSATPAYTTHGADSYFYALEKNLANLILGNRLLGRVLAMTDTAPKCGNLTRIMDMSFYLVALEKIGRKK